MKASRVVPVVDIFAGPGGLGEGFSTYRSGAMRPFKIGLSIEMDSDAHQTLELRSFFRHFQPQAVPEAYYQFLRGELSREELFHAYPSEADAAKHEAWLATLGDPSVDRTLNQRIRDAISGAADWVLCGGPPCQAYSIVGRSRTGGIREEDHRLYLYKEYLNILATHEPPVFIMENVKGLLSSQVQKQPIFAQLLEDLHAPSLALGKRRAGARYRVWSLVQEPRGYNSKGDPEFDHQQYVIRCELFGVPQSRHRVILLGIREDRWNNDVPTLVPSSHEIPVSKVLSGLPRLRSGISRVKDSPELWLQALARVPLSSTKAFPNGHGSALVETIYSVLSNVVLPRADRGGVYVRHKSSIEYLPKWFLDDGIQGVCNHESRPHMESDLHRYLFAAAYGKLFERSPELRDFPKSLLPAHKNVEEVGKEKYFDDRFRVQLSHRPSMTVTCHIAKDGHYYIHPDPTQCRTLTVREAARIQTFPDNYFFCGTRTSQYRQVGNAVPPLIAVQIADIVARVLGLRGKPDRAGIEGQLNAMFSGAGLSEGNC